MDVAVALSHLTRSERSGCATTASVVVLMLRRVPCSVTWSATVVHHARAGHLLLCVCVLHGTLSLLATTEAARSTSGCSTATEGTERGGGEEDSNASLRLSERPVASVSPPPPSSLYAIEAGECHPSRCPCSYPITSPTIATTGYQRSLSLSSYALLHLPPTSAVRHRLFCPPLTR